MKRLVLKGITGANPLGFLASAGLLRVASLRFESARLGFLDDGSYHPFVEGVDAPLAQMVADDAASQEGEQLWRLKYEKIEKNGSKSVADLKAPPAAFRAFLEASLEAWVGGAGDGAAFAAAYGTSTAVDGKGNTKPTAFHFTAANQQFLGAIEESRSLVTKEWVQQSLFEGQAARPGGNVRWDPAADRNYALMAENPNVEGTSVNAPLEWLAFRALPLFPSLPIGSRVFTTAVNGRGDEMAFAWPLWCVPASIRGVAGLLRLPIQTSPARGVFGIGRSAIRRTSQGFGNFGPASIAS